MATASGSSASHGFPKQLRPGLPLIPCGKCRDKTKIVMDYRVKKEGHNKGRIFYNFLTSRHKLQPKKEETTRHQAAPVLH